MILYISFGLWLVVFICKINIFMLQCGKILFLKFMDFGYVYVYVYIIIMMIDCLEKIFFMLR